jgi:hypothetical protein
MRDNRSRLESTGRLLTAESLIRMKQAICSKEEGAMKLMLLVHFYGVLLRGFSTFFFFVSFLLLLVWGSKFVEKLDPAHASTRILQEQWF